MQLRAQEKGKEVGCELNFHTKTIFNNLIYDSWYRAH